MTNRRKWSININESEKVTKIMWLYQVTILKIYINEIYENMKMTMKTEEYVIAVMKIYEGKWRNRILWINILIRKYYIMKKIL